MSKRLKGCWAKLERARSHVDALEADIVAWADDPLRNSIGIRPYPDSNGPGFHLVVEAVPEYPLDDWGVIVGDVLHNLRSALDQLAFQLVLTGTSAGLSEQQLRRVYFPIYDRQEDFRNACPDRLPGVRLRQVAQVEREQPYKRYTVVSLSPLRRIRELSNTDKHRLVAPLVFASQEEGGTGSAPLGDQGIGRIDWYPNQPIAHGTIIGYATSAVGTELKVDSQGQVSTYVAFEDGARASVYFAAMLGCVGRILKSFVPFFDSRPQSVTDRATSSESEGAGASRPTTGE